MSRRSIANLEREIEACRICVERPDGRPLAHDPRPVVRLSSTARICVAGQAPGNRVHASGVPFSDPSGERLRDWMGISPDIFYDTERIAIVPMGFCFPGLDQNGGDLPPRRECSREWHERIFGQMHQLELILLIGGYAQRWHLGTKARGGVTETVRHWRDYLPRYLPLPHPSWRNSGWLRRNIWFEDEILPHLRTEVHRLI